MERTKKMRPPIASPFRVLILRPVRCACAGRTHTHAHAYPRTHARTRTRTRSHAGRAGLAPTYPTAAAHLPSLQHPHVPRAHPAAVRAVGRQPEGRLQHVQRHGWGLSVALTVYCRRKAQKPESLFVREYPVVPSPPVCRTEAPRPLPCDALVASECPFFASTAASGSLCRRVQRSSWRARVAHRPPPTARPTAARRVR